jgi:hypothetical protein
MSPAAIIESLVTAGRAEDYAAIAAIPGVSVHAEVLRFSDSLRRGGLAPIEELSALDRAAFVKALAVYENTVGGLGSVTALERVLPLIQDEDHTILDWILSTTRSYWYYSNGARSYAELQEIKAANAERRAQNEKREAERERFAKERKAEQASANLFNAIRRGDTKAVEALLRQGAAPQGLTPDGTPLVRYAEENNRTAIAQLLRQAQGGASAA